MEEGKKRCPQCEQEKDFSAFGKNKNYTDKLNRVCKVCHNTRQTEYRVKYPERSRETAKRSYQKHRKKRLQDSKNYRDRKKQELEQANQREG